MARLTYISEEFCSVMKLTVQDLINAAKELDRNQLQNLVNVVGGVTISTTRVVAKEVQGRTRRVTTIDKPQEKFKASLPELKNLFATANLKSMSRQKAANKLNKAGFLTPNGLKFNAHAVTNLMAKHI